LADLKYMLKVGANIVGTSSGAKIMEQLFEEIL